MGSSRTIRQTAERLPLPGVDKVNDGRWPGGRAGSQRASWVEWVKTASALHLASSWIEILDRAVAHQTPTANRNRQPDLLCPPLFLRYSFLLRNITGFIWLCTTMHTVQLPITEGDAWRGKVIIDQADLSLWLLGLSPVVGSRHPWYTTTGARPSSYISHGWRY